MSTRPEPGTPEELIWLRGFEAGVEQMRRDMPFLYRFGSSDPYRGNMTVERKCTCMPGEVCGNAACPHLPQTTC